MNLNFFLAICFSVLVGLAVGTCAEQALAIEPGESVSVQGLCKSRVTVERHLALVEEDRNYVRLAADFREQLASGECGLLPQPQNLRVEEVGRTAPQFRDSDGDMVTISIIRVRDFWTLNLAIAATPHN